MPGFPRSLARLRFTSFQSRLVALFGGLLVLVQGLALVAVDRANLANTRAEVDRSLEVAAEVFSRLLADRSHELVNAATVLSADFAFKQAVATADAATVRSVLESLASRVDADVMTVVRLDGTVLAHTGATASTVLAHSTLAGTSSDADATPVVDPALANLLASASESDDGSASRLVFLGNRPFQLIVVPLLAPIEIAQIAVGFSVDDALAAELERRTLSDVSLLRQPAPGTTAGGWQVFASSLPRPGRGPLLAAVDDHFSGADLPPAGQGFTLEVAGEATVALVVPIESAETSVALLQRSLEAAMQPHHRLRLVLLALFGAGVGLSLVLARAIARGVTRPVAALAGAASRVQAGDLSPRVEVGQVDELGQLGQAFNHMVQGLAERDRVRDLLGKVVSPEIAQELLSHSVELGGEERQVTMLFSDVRGFTSLAEGRPPRQVLALLNRYLTRMSGEIEATGGVVDKYIGDAVMALYGAPLAHVDDADRAVRAAQGMCSSLAALNRELVAEGLPRLAIGIGIHSDEVLAGNMGSESRLNYTVIGDGVNLASRLEGLTKRYGVEILVSATTAGAAGRFAWRELDRVRVKGKRDAVTILEPAGEVATLDASALAELERWRATLALARARSFAAAGAELAALRAAVDRPLYRLWQERVAGWLVAPPPDDWDGTTTFTEK